MANQRGNRTGGGRGTNQHAVKGTSVAEERAGNARRRTNVGAARAVADQVAELAGYDSARFEDGLRRRWDERVTDWQERGVSRDAAWSEHLERNEWFDGEPEITQAAKHAFDAAWGRADAARHDQEAYDSFERSDTDGFVSQWASGVSGKKARLQAEIDEAGGMAEFPALLDAEGNRVQAKLIDSRHGPVWVRCDDEGEFVRDSSGKPEFLGKKRMRELGYTEGKEMAPAKAVTWAPPGATGLSGATSVQVVKVRTDDGTGRPQPTAE